MTKIFINVFILLAVKRNINKIDFTGEIMMWRKKTKILLLVLLAGFSPTIRSFSQIQERTKGMLSVDTSGRAIEKERPVDKSKGRRFCLLVACGRFADEKIPPLPLCEKDVTNMENILLDENRGIFDETRKIVLKGPDVTRQKLLDSIRSIAKETKPNDTVFVYFSGHGAVDTIGTSLNRKLNAYLLMHETDPKSLQATAVSMQEFTEELIGCDANDVVIFLDACHSGSAGTGVNAELPQTPVRCFVPPDVVNAKGMQLKTDFQASFQSYGGRYLVSACDRDELAYEFPQLGNGLMTYYLTKALKGAADLDGDRFVDLYETFNYIQKNVSEFCTANNSPPQTPTQYSKTTSGRCILSVVSNKGLSAREIEQMERAIRLRGRIEANDWIDGSLEEEITEFSKDYPDDQYTKTLMQVLYTYNWEETKKKIGKLPNLDHQDKVKLEEWKVSALKILSEYETKYPGSQHIKEVQERAATIRDIEKTTTEESACVNIPATTFIMGRDHGGSCEESPAVKISLSAFRIDKYEVTNLEYSKFIATSGYDNKRYWSEQGWIWKETEKINQPAFWNDPDLGISNPDKPVVGVSWYEAEAYAMFAGDRVRLPTEAEWERTARGRNGGVFPWGDAPHLNRANFGSGSINSDGSLYTASINTFKEDVTEEGCRHMAGNVAEWVLDSFQPEIYGTQNNSTDPYCSIPAHKKVFRGGDWCRGAFYMSTTQRDWADPGARLKYLGFRLVRNGKKHSQPSESIIND